MRRVGRLVAWCLVGSIAVLFVWLGSWRRDDSTQAVRHMAAVCLSVPLKDISADATMGQLGFTKHQFLELVHRIEQELSTTIDATDALRIAGNDARWKEIRIIDLADMVRPEWSRRPQQRLPERGMEAGAGGPDEP